MNNIIPATAILRDFIFLVSKNNTFACNNQTIEITSLFSENTKAIAREKSEIHIAAIE